MKKKYVLVGAVISLMTVIAACSGSGSEGSGSATPTTSSASVATATTAPAAPSNDEAIALGKKEFVTCAGCHAADATGITGLGKNLVGSDFIGDISDTDLALLIKTGRTVTDPANTTGIDMPPKGGNPALNDEKIDGIVAYIRSLQ